MTGLHIITQIGSLSLSQLRDTHSVYRRVVRHEWDAQRGWQALKTIGNASTPFSGWQQSLIAFFAGFTITLLAFDGSTADACCAGLFAALLSGLALLAATSNPLIAKVFECVTPILLFRLMLSSSSIESQATCCLCNICNFTRSLFSYKSQIMLFCALLWWDSLDTSWVCC